MAQDPPVRDPYQPYSAGEAAARGAAGLRGAPTASEVIAGLRATSNSADLIQVLSPEGTFTPHPDFPIEVTAELLQGLYRDMVLVRRFDREGNALQRQGQLSIWVPLLGQEAAQIGAGRALRSTDMAFPSYREHGVAWCRGVDPTELLGIFRGSDHCGWDPQRHPVQQLHDRHRQPGAERRRLRDGPALRRRCRCGRRRGRVGHQRGDHRLLR